MQNHLEILNKFDELSKKHSLSYLIIGGLAASYWGTVRFTADIDLVIGDDSLDLATNILSQLDYKLDFLHPKKTFAHFSAVNNNQFRIDLMIVEKSTWIQLINEAKNVPVIFDKLLPMVSPLHLIAMKLHAINQPDRSTPIKDLNDIAEIMTTQMISFVDLEKNDILRKYGSETTNIRLKDLLDSKRGRRSI